MSENIEDAWKFIDWYGTAETAEVAHNELGNLPTRASLLQKFVDEEIIPGGNFIF
ncbi:unnamed protein product, partial [marine sediment metagenome]